jgi:hypothetical protein
VEEAAEITVLQPPKFKAEATDPIGTDGIEAVAAYLTDHPDGGDPMPGSGGARKLRWAAKKQGKTWRSPHRIRVPCDCRSHLPDSMPRPEHQSGSIGG